MDFLKELHETYQQAHALAARSLAKAKKHGLPACPAALNALTDDKLISYRLDLGFLDIPVSLIVGAAEANENTALYTKEFFPLSLPKPSSRINGERSISSISVRKGCVERSGALNIWANSMSAME